jgi:hypothetical protein
MEKNETFVKVVVAQEDPSDSKELERIVDVDIAAFDTYFQGLGNDPLSRPERAIIKTFLHWKVKGPQPHGPETGS